MISFEIIKAEIVARFLSHSSHPRITPYKEGGE
jgi:hypothetical protein